MKLELDKRKASGYKNPSQIARVLTEGWARDNVYCPNCGQANLSAFENNRPVADFFCDVCREQFELKSKRGRLGKKIVDGAYQTMLERVSAANNPSFFFLTYTPAYQVKNFLIIPKHFFVPTVVEKRKALPPTARRAGWQGCNIVLSAVPESGRIFYVRGGEVAPKRSVLAAWQKTVFLRRLTQKNRGWLLDVLACVERLPRTFELQEVYAFEAHLADLHPENKHVRAKIRQQLQVLRDRGFISFKTRGHYEKL